LLFSRQEPKLIGIEVHGEESTYVGKRHFARVRSHFLHMATFIPSHASPQLGHTKATVDRFTIADNLRKATTSLVNNGINAAIMIGLVSPNGTQFYGYGKMSAAMVQR
jgi:hypothetical protein